jgi:hypothetical protein
MRASAAVPAKRSLGTTTRSAGGDACFSAKEQMCVLVWRVLRDALPGIGRRLGAGVDAYPFTSAIRSAA